MILLHGRHVTANGRLPAAVVGGGYGDVVITSVTTSNGVTTTDGTIDTIAMRIMVPTVNNGALCIYHHGSGESYNAIGAGLKGGVVDAILAAGWILASSSAHGENWGNAASLLDYEKLYYYISDEHAISHLVHFSQSMGGLSGLNTVARRTIPADGWFGIYPICSLAAAHAGAFSNGINAAYNLGNYATLTAGFDPALNDASQYAGVPMRFYASPDDTLVPKVDHTDVFRTLIAADPAEHELVTCTGNHGDASHFQPADVVSFLGRCIA